MRRLYRGHEPASRGLSLPEVLIAASMTLMLLGVTSSMLKDTQDFYKRNDAGMSLDFEAMNAMNQLGPDLTETSMRCALVLPGPTEGDTLVYALPRDENGALTQDTNGALLWTKQLVLGKKIVGGQTCLLKFQSLLPAPLPAPPPFPAQIPPPDPDAITEQPRIIARGVDSFKITKIDSPAQLLLELKLAKQVGSEELKIVVRSGFSPRN